MRYTIRTIIFVETTNIITTKPRQTQQKTFTKTIKSVKYVLRACVCVCEEEC